MPFFLFLSIPKISVAANVTCGPGQTYTTFAAAVNAAGANGSVTLTGPVTETISPNAYAGLMVVTGDGPQTVYLNSVGINYQLSNGGWAVTNIAFVHQVAMSSMLQFTGGNGSSSTFTGCNFISTFADTILNIADVHAIFTNCGFIGNGSVTCGLRLSNYNGQVNLSKCIIRDIGAGYGYFETTNHDGVLETFYFCDFINNKYGMQLMAGNSAEAVTNCIFASTTTTNTSEINSAQGYGTAPVADYCTFRTLPTGGNPVVTLGSHNKTSTANAEFMNAVVGSEDLHLLSTAQSKGSGLAVSGITTDYGGTTLNAPPDIGAFAYISANSPTNTPTWTFTPTHTATISATPTITHTFTITAVQNVRNVTLIPS
jgi:hypothetical protein